MLCSAGILWDVQAQQARSAELSRLLSQGPLQGVVQGLNDTAMMLSNGVKVMRVCDYQDL